MEDLIKIAANGQWTLEKAKLTRAEEQRMIDEHKARVAARSAATASPQSSMPTGMKPAALNTGVNPDVSKEKLAALRAGIDRGQTKSSVAPKAVAPDDAKTRVAEAAADHAEKVRTKLGNEQVKADEKAKVGGSRKEAWEAAVGFLAQHGNRGYQAIKEHMDQRKILDQAHETGKMPVKPKQELIPPQAPSIDPVTKQRTVGPRQGTFHGEGATTSGKIVHVKRSYKDKDGEEHFTSAPHREEHLWSWDHNDKKKWNHVKTRLVSPNLDQGKGAPIPEQGSVKRAAPRSFADEQAAHANRPIRDD